MPAPGLVVSRLGVSVGASYRVNEARLDLWHMAVSQMAQALLAGGGSASNAAGIPRPASGSRALHLDPF